MIRELAPVALPSLVFGLHMCLSSSSFPFLAVITIALHDTSLFILLNTPQSAVAMTTPRRKTHWEGSPCWGPSSQNLEGMCVCVCLHAFQFKSKVQQQSDLIIKALKLHSTVTWMMMGGFLFRLAEDIFRYIIMLPSLGPTVSTFLWVKMGVTCTNTAVCEDLLFKGIQVSAQEEYYNLIKKLDKIIKTLVLKSYFNLFGTVLLIEWMKMQNFKNMALNIYNLKFCTDLKFVPPLLFNTFYC